MTTIVQALAAVMNDVQGVRKGERNTAPNGNYMFRGIDAVTNAVGPALRRHGVIVTPTVEDATYETVEVGKHRTLMSRAILRIRWTWWGPEGDSIQCVTQGEAFDSGDKATAKAHAVAFRTAMLQTLCLPTDEKGPDHDTYERAGSFDMGPWAERIAAARSADELRAVWLDAKSQGVEKRIQGAVNRRKAEVAS